MTLKLSLAEEKDAADIASIHMAAFATNRMLLAQFSTPAVRDGLQTSIARKTLDDICDPHTSVLVVKEVSSDRKIISFAKWSLPSSNSENEVPWVWPDGTRHDILDVWTERVESAKERALGSEPCYRMAAFSWHRWPHTLLMCLAKLTIYRPFIYSDTSPV